MISIFFKRIIKTLTVFLVFLSSTVFAAEKTLEFDLITKALDPRQIEVPNVENQVLTQSRVFGVGVFKDGRIAVKEFVAVSDLNKGIGQFSGYSTYTFDDGSSITARYSAEWKANHVAHGEYKILSGTGAYAGATGTGTLDSAPTQFKGVGFFKIRLRIQTP